MNKSTIVPPPFSGSLCLTLSGETTLRLPPFSAPRTHSHWDLGQRLDQQLEARNRPEKLSLKNHPCFDVLVPKITKNPKVNSV
jgi:hypothetical protein